MEIKEECKKKIAKQKLEKHEEIPSHENFEKDTKVLKAERSWGWLQRGGLKKEMKHCLLLPKIRRPIPTRCRRTYTIILFQIFVDYTRRKRRLIHKDVGSERLQEASRQSLCTPPPVFESTEI